MGAETVLISAQQRNAILLDSGAFTDAGSRYRDLNQDYAVRALLLCYGVDMQSRHVLRARDSSHRVKPGPMQAPDLICMCCDRMGQPTPTLCLIPYVGSGDGLLC